MLPGIKLFDMTGQTAIITGGSKGLGKAMASGLASAGARIAVVSRNQSEAEEAASEITSIHGTEAIGIQADVTQTSEIESMVATVTEKFGRIDGLVNNAPSIHTGKIIDLDMPSWRTNFKANLDAVFLTTKTVLPWMIAAKKGSIVNVASVVGLRGTAYMSGYGAAKSGLINFSKTSAIEAAPNVRVNCVIPGAVQTPATERAIPNEDLMEATIKTIPLKRIAKPEELAAPIVFLLSSEASFITGADLIIDGGKTADLNAGN